MQTKTTGGRWNWQVAAAGVAVIAAAGLVAARAAPRSISPASSGRSRRSSRRATKPGDAPSDAVVLFDGKDLSAWKNGDTWKVEDGVDGRSAAA